MLYDAVKPWISLVIADPLAGNLSAVGHVVAYSIEAADGAGFQHDSKRQNLSDAGNVEETIIGLAQFRLSLDNALNGFDLTGQKTDGFFTFDILPVNSVILPLKLPW